MLHFFSAAPTQPSRRVNRSNWSRDASDAGTALFLCRNIFMIESAMADRRLF